MLFLSLGLREPHLGIHIDDRENAPSFGRCVRAGTMQRPAEVEAHVAHRVWLLDFEDFLLLDRVADLLLALLAYFKVSTNVFEVAAAPEAQWAHFDWHGL